MSNMRIIEIPASMRENAGRKNTVRKLRVAAYCRVSTEEEEQQGSFEIQKLYYTEKINSTPEWEVAGIYADDGISGSCSVCSVFVYGAFTLSGRLSQNRSTNIAES